MALKNMFSSNKFKFNLTSSRFKDNEFDLAITDINVPGIQLGTTAQGTTTRVIDLPGDSITFNDLTVEFIISEDFGEWIEMYNWMYDLRNFDQPIFDNTILSDGSLILLTNKSNANVIISFKNLYPFDLQDLQLSISTADVSPLKGSVTFKYTEFEVSTSP